MIRRIYSTLPHFKHLDFGVGLNVLLAEKSAKATDKHTRNRAGKSSLLEIIHFLMGSSCKPDNLFRNPALIEATFGMEFDLAGSFARVERSGTRPSPVTVSGDAVAWPVKPSVKHGVGSLSNENWKAVLGKLMFGIDETSDSWGPSLRSLISYFVRREREGGMSSPMEYAKKQQPVDQQVSVSFLMGLDWTVPREWQPVREQERALEVLRKSLRDGAFGAVVGKASQLKSELIVAEDRIRQLKTAVSSFRVLEQYHDLEREASQLTKRLGELADENILDQRYLADLKSATVEESPPAPTDLEGLFHEAGVVFPSLVKRRFEEVAAFHDSVVRNRSAYLEAEVSAAQRRISSRDDEKRVLDARRSEVMQILASAGALEHFTALQGELTKAQSFTEALKQRHAAAESLESGQIRQRVARATLVERLKRNYIEQDAVVQEAVLTFSRISTQLYESSHAGQLTISPTENGPMFDAHIPGEKSKGVNNMRIFCFDMTMMLLALRRGRSPGFLVHDSHLFDGVDERQVGKALALGGALAKEHGFQYVVTMNTDDIPRELPSGFRVEDHALPVRLTDATEDGGLFGFRFD